MYIESAMNRKQVSSITYIETLMIKLKNERQII